MLPSISTFVFLVFCTSLLHVSESEGDLASSLLVRSSLWECSSDTDCTTNNSTCVDGSCVCDGGYIYNTAMTECLLTATALGDECTETLQCSTYLLTGAVCDSGVCACGDGYHYTRGRCYSSSGLGESCTADVNCYANADAEALSCVNGVCACSDGFYQREYRTCRRGGYAEGEECTIDLDCQFENSVCNSSYVCAYSETDNSTETTRLFEIDDYQIYDDDEEEEEEEEESRSVRSLGRTIETECVSDANCTSVANSRCGAAGYCICNRAYFASTDLTSCIPEMGEECTDGDDVLITNSLCRNGTWSCGYTTVASISQRICRKSTKHYNWSCLHDEQCYIFGPDSSCQSKRCLCDEGSHLVEDLLYCWVSKGIGESCQADEDCYVDGIDDELTCTNSVCACPNGTVANSNSTACKAENAALGETCEDSTDCYPANSVCLDSVCACPDNYYELDEACAAGLDAPCSSDSDCVVTNAACSNSTICECIDNYVGDSDACYEVAGFGDACESDLQCSAALSNSYCSDSVCQCESDYHYRFGACNLKSAIGDSCTSLADCYVEDGLEDVVCRSGVCACSFESTASGTTICSRTSDATSFHLSTWMGVMLLGAKILVA